MLKIEEYQLYLGKEVTITTKTGMVFLGCIVTGITEFDGTLTSLTIDHLDSRYVIPREEVSGIYERNSR